MDVQRPYQLSERVGLRPEPFGAMAYHFDTRRLVFLKTPDLVELVHSLASFPSLAAAVVAAAGGQPRKVRSYTRALESLLDAGVIAERVEATHTTEVPA
jgi:putative mycofactocin binding protein MftB